MQTMHAMQVTRAMWAKWLIRGWARVELETIGEIRVEAGDVWYQPPNVKHELVEYSDDFEVLEITMPAEFETRDETR